MSQSKMFSPDMNRRQFVKTLGGTTLVFLTSQYGFSQVGPKTLGDVVLDAKDLLAGRTWPDAAFPCTWGIDLHAPNPKFQKGLEGEEFISEATVIGDQKKDYQYQGPYWAPYRCLYSRNIPNLFMAGRDISVPHEGLGPVRVMRTCGMMGEIVGMAASLGRRHDTSPRGVYERHLAALRELMHRGVGRRD